MVRTTLGGMPESVFHWKDILGGRTNELLPYARARNAQLGPTESVAWTTDIDPYMPSREISGRKGARLTESDARW